jgi:replication factor A1
LTTTKFIKNIKVSSLGEMIDIPLSMIIEKIKEKSSMSDQEIEDKIKTKLDQLSGLISKEGAAHIIANELGIKLLEPDSKLQVKNVLTGMRNVELIGKVTRVFEVREFKTEKHAGKVGNFLVADETGIIRVVLWHKQADNLNDLKEGDVVKIKGAYVRDNNGRKELHLSDSSQLYINPKGVEIGEVAVAQRPVKKTISELGENEASVEVLATIVQVFDPRFFEVCPECNARMRLQEDNLACPTHGKIDPRYNYVLNLFLDDGSDNIRAVLWKNQVLQLLEKKDDEVQLYREKPTAFDDMKTDLLGNIVKITGRTNKNETFGRVELVAESVDKHPDPDAEIARLKEESEKMVDESEAPKKVKEEVKEVVEPLKKEDTTSVESESVKAEIEDDEVKSLKSEEESVDEELLSLDDLDDLDK